jgi:hypothetical protein
MELMTGSNGFKVFFYFSLKHCFWVFKKHRCCDKNLIIANDVLKSSIILLETLVSYIASLPSFFFFFFFACPNKGKRRRDLN